MSIEGSFSSRASLERFLLRCPKLQHNLIFQSLIQRGDELTEDVIVSSLAEPLLHPLYTIPLFGCFRHLGRRIVDKSVNLLRRVPDLGSNSGDDEGAVELGEDEIRVIEFYQRTGRNLKLHELVSLALCRVLDLAPFLLESVLNYFSFAPCPFQRLAATWVSHPLQEKGMVHLLDPVRISFRFLQMEPNVFSEKWNWSCFLDLVDLSRDVNMDEEPEFLKNILDIKWCCVQILSVVMRMSDRAVPRFGLAPEISLLCFNRWEEFCQDVAMEKAGLYLHSSDLEARGQQDHHVVSPRENFRSISFSHSHESQSTRRVKKITCDGKSGRIRFVLTSSMRKCFEFVSQALTQKWPIFVYGPTGAGKTALIRELAERSGNRVIFLHMDEQMDSKQLIGSYVCAEQPGQFRWQPGCLTQAVMSGYWVVFEDIDKAPSEVHSILLPLLEGAGSYMMGHGEAIKVAESFQLFATASSSKDDSYQSAEVGRINLGLQWRKVAVRNPTDIDLLDIVRTCFPCLEPLAQKLIDTFKRVNFLASHQLSGVQVDANSGFSQFTLRDLCKWCKRISGSGLSVSGNFLLPSDCKIIYQEAWDTFVASSASFSNRLSLMKEIAKMWGLPLVEEEHLYYPSKPAIKNLAFDLQVGRVTLKYLQAGESGRAQSKAFVEISSSVHILECIASSIKYDEPVLLVGETGTGKTTLIQNLATRLGQHLTVLNLSQQSDVADLLGGFKPTDARFICMPLYEEFKDLFRKSYSKKVNEGILTKVAKYVTGRKWKELLLQFQAVFNLHKRKVHEWHESGRGIKRKRPLGDDVLQQWEAFAAHVGIALNQISGSLVPFSFVEGALVTAIKKGQWILLDEINLAPPETLQGIVGVLDPEGTLSLAEMGEVESIVRHPNFRIFACMNPATDAGKKDLPYSVRSRFTEYFVDDTVSTEDLTLFVSQYMDEVHGDKTIVDKIVRFYQKAKLESEKKLQDGAYQKPQFSLRSLARALGYVKKAKSSFGFDRALYDAFCMFFLTPLDGPSAKLMNKWIIDDLLSGKKPHTVHFVRYIKEHDLERVPKNYVVTNSIEMHLANLARAVFIKRYPVLLQGPTSSGKTSLVQYLAAIAGCDFVRINNHEHTDLQEYFGTYVPDSQGKLKFQEGALLKAVRNGHWIVLDELNLAPSDVLEALNRLLDDNRELFVPELLETIPAHPNFMLFATQNPPTLYAGRKMVSRAFRNRFLEIHVDEIPEDELVMILVGRCQIPKSRAVKMVSVMKDLHLHRQSSKVFAGKQGFMTPRDLFRWAERCKAFESFSDEDMAKDGYYLLAERLRDQLEKDVVGDILQKRFLHKISYNALNRDELYIQRLTGCRAAQEFCAILDAMKNCETIIWSKSMWRLCFLVVRCYLLREPVLLVGETGGGKTTVCQFLSTILGSKLHILNCHQYTETSDFLGGFYPIRDRSRILLEYKDLVEQLEGSKVFVHFPGKASVQLSPDFEHAPTTVASLENIISSYKHSGLIHSEVTEYDLDAFEELLHKLVEVQNRWQTLFLWQDGPLVEAMKNGDLFLVDEISLADDSVLERLNSVLEPEKKLTLAEKGGFELEEITAHPHFFVLATMNPGGDYGKKELSPALQNRFTQIWVPPVSDLDELKVIALNALNRLKKSELSCIVDCMLKFWEWFNRLQTGRVLTIRDLLAWIAFINATESSLGSTSAFLHGAFLVVLDGLSLGTGISRNDASKLRERCLLYLVEQLQVKYLLFDPRLSKLETFGWGVSMKITGSCFSNVASDNVFGISPFYIMKGDKTCKQHGFEFTAPTTCRNALRVLRALQLPKPVLLEGSPGVGKTSLVISLAEFSGNAVVRINLSEQTDIMDLLGSDLPVENDGEGMGFAWSDGILLQALKNGSWVLLDELNLAPQSVLEGLNAILDHRAEVYIPELGSTFKCPPSFRVFACQNPPSQGGGRKGLPKSFLNRFTKVYIDELVQDDYLSICISLHPSIPTSLLSKLICFNNRLYEDTMVLHKYGQEGSPWEFNLRDVLRSCQMIESAPEKSKIDCFLSSVYIQRMRSANDRREVLHLYEDIFGVKPSLSPYPGVQISPNNLLVGTAFGERNHFQPTKILKRHLHVLPGIRHSLETALHCMQHNWLCILVGPSSSGKTSLVRLLAYLTGNTLHELNLSPGTDISELLGCFEQYNAFRHFRDVLGQVERSMNEYFNLLLQHFPEVLIGDSKDLVNNWFAFLSQINYSSSVSGFNLRFAECWKSRSQSLLGNLIEIIELLRLDVQKHHLTLSSSCADLDKCLRTILKLKENDMQSVSAKFEWVTGGLIKAIECGEWVLLENANLCNPTVLDRINSLVEPAGSITVNECGLVNGKPLVLLAHPKFRLFLTVDPSYGEISRAMRNRGVELYMMSPYWMLERCDHEEAESRELKRLLVVSGIPVTSLIDAMVKAHIYARDKGSRFGVRLTLLEFTYWVRLFQQLLMTGERFLRALHKSWEHIYISSLGEGEGMDIVEYVKANILLDLGLQGYSLSLPGGWPAPLNLGSFVWFSREASIKQNFVYVEFLAAQSAAHNASFRSNGNLFIDKLELLPAIVPTEVLHGILYPSIRMQKLKNVRPPESNFSSLQCMSILEKKLFVSANWAMEQATEADFLLYHAWFKWYSSKFEPYCSSLKYFVSSLERERDHVIWKNIVNCSKEISSNLRINGELQLFPLLSLELVELAVSKFELETPKRILENSIQSVELLRCSFQQWCREDSSIFGEDPCCLAILPVFRFLRDLELQVLDIIVEFADFESLYQLYDNLFEHHILLWTSINSFILKGGQFIDPAEGMFASSVEVSGPHAGCTSKVEKRELLVMSWYYLRKQVLKLQDKLLGGSDCLWDSLDYLLVELRKIEENSVWNFKSSKSRLWIHGGHPIMPSSKDEYSKMQELFLFCSSVWPMTLKSWNKLFYEERHVPSILLAADVELKYLALQGMGLASCITAEDFEDSTDAVQQLKDICQMLQDKMHGVERLLLDKERVAENDLASACCVLEPKLLLCDPSVDCWLASLPLIVRKSLALDMTLLQELSKGILVNSEDKLDQVFSSISGPLRYALDFSLTSTSRPPTDFLPHQKILWMLGASASIDQASACAILSNVVCEMWFKWHSSLWMHSSKQLKTLTGAGHKPTSVPSILFQPTITLSLNSIFRSAYPVKDYGIHLLMLRANSRDLWQYAPFCSDLVNVLLSMGRTLFKQILFTYKKSFDADKFEQIQTLFEVLDKNNTQIEVLVLLKQLIELSSDAELTAVVDLCIEPLLQELYAPCQAHDFLSTLGKAWLHIGELRFRLLRNQFDPNDFDPTLKYWFKYLRVQEKMASIELDLQVREECNHLSGETSDRNKQRKLKLKLENLEREKKRLGKKLVYRPEPAKYAKLKYECADFLKWVEMSVILAKNFESVDDSSHDSILLIDKACNWQDSSTSFINRLSEEYTSFGDIIQPVQIAVFEMKLGLSLVVSNAIQKKFLFRVHQSKTEEIMRNVVSFVQYPRSFSVKPIKIGVNTMQPDFPSSMQDVFEHILAMDVNMWRELVSIEEDTFPIKMEAFILHNLLVRMSHFLNIYSLVDKASFSFLDEIFQHFSNVWLNLKSKMKEKVDDESQQFKFKSRAFEVEDILKIDVSELRKFASDGSLSSEWEEILGDGDPDERKNQEMDEFLEQEWKYMDESIFPGIVRVHNQLFGSNNLVDQLGKFQVSDEEKIESFMDSYEAGSRIIQELPHIWSSFVDVTLIPEHLFRVCVDYHKKCSFQPASSVYNFYKHPNSLLLAKMVKPLSVLQSQLLLILNDLPDHSVVQKIFNIVEVLLALPPETPLGKALLGLQLLVNRLLSLEENGSRLLSDQLQPMLILINSWRKLEIETWPSLLDGVLAEYEVNAGKLWFPLYSVLHRELSVDVEDYNLATFESLKNFIIGTTSIGEFKKRLELLLAFYGHFKTSLSLKIPSCRSVLLHKLNILYNVFGYFVQFLPLISEYIEANRRTIEKELKELSRLSGWEDPRCYPKHIHQKLWKLVEKFNILLQQPVMNVLKQDEMQGRMIEVPNFIQPKAVDNAKETESLASLNHIDLAHFGGLERSFWYESWRKKLDVAFSDLYSGEKVNYMTESDVSWQLDVEEWRAESSSLREIFGNISECAHLLKQDSPNVKKRNVLRHLIKILQEKCGLSKYVSKQAEVDPGSNRVHCFYLLPSYNIRHLLLYGSPNFSKIISDHFSSLCAEKLDQTWGISNAYYYKNILMVEQIRQIRLASHKDISQDQVESSISFIEHLVMIQQDQRSVGYGFSEQLDNLRRQAILLKEFRTSTGTRCSITSKQYGTYKYLWEQKQLLDSLYAVSKDMSLLLRTVKNIHLDACDTVRCEVDSILCVIDKSSMKLQKSKESVDHYLLGSTGVLTTPEMCTPPFILSDRVEKLVMENFIIVNEFDKDIESLLEQGSLANSVKNPLLCRLENLTRKGMLLNEAFHSEVKQENQACEEEISSPVSFDNVKDLFGELYPQILGVFEKLRLFVKAHSHSEGSLTEINSSWRSFIENLEMDLLYNRVERTIISVHKLLNQSDSRQAATHYSIEKYLGDLHSLLDVVLTLAESLLLEFVVMHKMVAEMTQTLASALALLFLQGFGSPETEEIDNTDGGKTQQSSGTGMGEGQGLNDVSDQIEDEGQLLGTMEKPSEETEAPSETPSKKDKGIEMDEDFNGDTHCVSEDSGDDEGDVESEDMKLDSVMGEGSDSKEKVDEKLWDKEDGEPNRSQEKDEPGPPAQETDTGSRELRAKDDLVGNDNEPDARKNGESNQAEETENADFSDDLGSENEEDLKVDKPEAVEGSTEIDHDGLAEEFKDEMSIDESEDESVEDAELGLSDDVGDTSEKDAESNQMEKEMGEADLGEKNDEVGPQSDLDENTETNLARAGEQVVEPNKMEPSVDHIHTAASAYPVDVAQHGDSSLQLEIQLSNGNVVQNRQAPSRGLDMNVICDTETAMFNLGEGGETTADEENVQDPSGDASTINKTQVNPYRSLGDALEEWKERIRVSSDSSEQKKEIPDDLQDDRAEEYRYVSEFEKGTSQALGPALLDQIVRDLKSSKSTAADDHGEMEGENLDEMEVETERHQLKKCATSVRQTIPEKAQDTSCLTSTLDLDEMAEEDLSLQERQTKDLVSVSNIVKDEILQFGNRSVNDKEMGMAKAMEIKAGGDSTSDWRRYDLETLRLSQELAEQLRLVLEPTLASKLQGDYKTGKRINMKKVIPYIASHFRKDKIWLRRTRPNKRDYQVVIAVDDSRSMSENRCGEFARKALVTVCRAMSQLELGQLAAVSFGQSGNIRLLHDFHQPFTTEAGLKMVASLEFKQENKIADAPMSDLLKFLNTKLEASTATACLASRQNPLQQLILIISDGHFHEQLETLKACVRDALRKKRMIAFIILDSSIVDLQVVSFGKGSSPFSMYLDSFPFPYYIVLKNIEALPRTLADLLRQWFELMQNA